MWLLILYFIALPPSVVHAAAIKAQCTGMTDSQCVIALRYKANIVVHFTGVLLPLPFTLLANASLSFKTFILIPAIQFKKPLICSTHIELSSSILDD
jgi:hypothetical protein